MKYLKIKNFIKTAFQHTLRYFNFFIITIKLSHEQSDRFGLKFLFEYPRAEKKCVKNSFAFKLPLITLFIHSSREKEKKIMNAHTSNE